MSSGVFSARLKPDPRLRIIVLLGAQLLGVAGCLILLQLTAPLPLRILAVAAWIGVIAYEIRRLRRGQRRCLAIRLSAGGVVEVQTGLAEWQPATLLEGSVLRHNIAWLRLATSDSGNFAELLTRNGQNDCDWRRLSVIWRHIGAAD